MEPFPKRQRLYVPLNHEFPQSFDNQHAYYDEQPDSLEDEFEDELQEEFDEEDLEEEEEEEEEVSDPDADLRQRRAQLDYKLKSTFEAIFDKYGQDFEGVGDEIDLETGEVVVNNGHLFEMHDERDAGDTSRRNPVRDYTEEPEDTDDVPTSSLEETEETDIVDEEDEDEEGDELLSEDEEMMEDDLILRGFARANRFVQASPELGSSRITVPPQREPRPNTVSRPVVRGAALPSRTDILAQFGPQLGPQIVDFVSQQQGPNDSHIEPAWRAPELPNFAPVKRATVKRATFAPEIERSPSPEASRSIWAPVRRRGPNKPKHAHAKDMFRGHSMMPVHGHSQPSNPFRRQSLDNLSVPYQNALPGPKRVRRNFTTEDDQIILDWVARAKMRGQPALADNIWRDLEAKHPYHSAASWKAHYKRSFTYLPKQANDFESDSEGSIELQHDLPRAKRVRIAFTDEDDEILLDWVERVRERGLALWSSRHWQELAERYPRHSMKSWQGRYQNHFRHLWSSQAEESQSITSETSIGTHVLDEREAAKAMAATTSQVPIHPPARERPSRIRKPAQRDSRIISWSEAVDTIQSLDPVLHAEMLEDNKRMKAGRWTSDYPRTEDNPSKTFSGNRPGVKESADGYQAKNSGRTFNDFAIPPTLPESTAVAASLSPEETQVRAPCPHADCRLYDTVLYKLQRLDNEDLSEMCLHLFRVHHTTPFPCGELGCKRKGEDGFFMQADLVKHVRLDHPNSGAFQRLRGRVDSDLLDRTTRSPKNMSSVPLNDRPVSRARDSDFMSSSKRTDGRITSSSRPFSSSSDYDRTPRGATGMLGASTSTPMTSVSSLKVHHSSGTAAAMREFSESQERLTAKEPMGEAVDMSNWTGHLPVPHSTGPGFARARTPPIREPLFEGPFLPRNATGRDGLPTPLASTWDSPGHEDHGNPGTRHAPQSIPRTMPEGATESGSPKLSSPTAMRTASGSQLPPSHKLAKSPSSLDKGRTSSVPEPRNKALSEKAHISPNLPRNTLDPSYEFSDEELGMEPMPTPMIPESNMNSSTVFQSIVEITASHATEPVSKSASAPAKAAEPATNNAFPIPATKRAKKPVAPQTTKSSVATPANKRKSTVQRVLDDDYDELSLGADDFVFMFSRPRTDARPTTDVRVKQEDSAETPQLVSSVPAKKRKLNMYRAGSDDELCVIGPSPPHPLSTMSKPEIKVEEDDAVLPLPLPTKSKVSRMRVNDIQVEVSASQTKHHAQQQKNIPSASTSTPLLDLTPSRSKPTHPNDGREILDSAAESSSPNQASSPTHPRKRTRGQREAGTSSPLVGLLTPARRKRSSGNPLEGEQVTVVVKTPSGTLRKCGEDGFECGRSFCFRCGEKGPG